ncbi:hypothetical protein D3C81_1284140 [compost metagenome]
MSTRLPIIRSSCVAIIRNPSPAPSDNTTCRSCSASEAASSLTRRSTGTGRAVDSLVCAKLRNCSTIACIESTSRVTPAAALGSDNISARSRSRASGVFRSCAMPASIVLRSWSIRARSATMRLKRSISCRNSCGPRSRKGGTSRWRDSSSAALAMSRTGRCSCHAISSANTIATPTTSITPGTSRLSGGGLWTQRIGMAIQSSRLGSLIQMRGVVSSSSRISVPCGSREMNCSTRRRERPPLGAVACSSALAVSAVSTRLGSFAGGRASSARSMLSSWNSICSTE